MVSEAEVNVFSGILLLFMIQQMLVTSGSSGAFSESRLYIWKFSVHILLKPSLKEFEHLEH